MLKVCFVRRLCLTSWEWCSSPDTQFTSPHTLGTGTIPSRALTKALGLSCDPYNRVTTRESRKSCNWPAASAHSILIYQLHLNSLRSVSFTAHNTANMSDESTQSQSPPRPGRRSSFAGQTFADLFSSGRPSISRGTTDHLSSSSPSAPQPVGPISKAAQQAQQRRLSLTTLGLSGSPNQTSPFNTYRTRGDSIGSANSGSIEESAIAEDEAAAHDPNSGGSPTNTPFARRTSFGARALRDIRGTSFSGQSGGGGGGAPGSPGQNGTNSPSLSSSSPSDSKTPLSKKKAQTGTISSRDAKGRGLSLATAPPSLPSSMLATKI